MDLFCFFEKLRFSFFIVDFFPILIFLENIGLPYNVTHAEHKSVEDLLKIMEDNLTEQVIFFLKKTLTFLKEEIPKNPLIAITNGYTTEFGKKRHNEVMKKKTKLIFF